MPVTELQICAGFRPGGVDGCQGDSGGPLMCLVESDRSHPTESWFLGGVVSYGYGCAKPGVPAVYTNVPAYISWIQANIEGGGELDENGNCGVSVQEPEWTKGAKPGIPTKLDRNGDFWTEKATTTTPTTTTTTTTTTEPTTTELMTTTRTEMEPDTIGIDSDAENNTDSLTSACSAADYENGVCKCAENYFYTKIEPYCIKCEGIHYQKGTCSCAKKSEDGINLGYFDLRTETCEDCDLSMILSPFIPECKCPAGMMHLPDTLQCVPCPTPAQSPECCAKGQEWDEAGQICTCPENYFFNNGTSGTKPACIPCSDSSHNAECCALQENTFFDFSKHKCKCDTGYQLNRKESELEHKKMCIPAPGLFRESALAMRMYSRFSNDCLQIF